MEEKKDEIRNSVRSFSGVGNLRKFFLLSYFPAKNTGFTLIELLVVIGVVGVLSAGIIVAIDPIKQMQRARDSQRKTDLKQIQAGLEIYRSDNGAYPAGSLSCGGTLASGGVTYINKVPCDPKSGWAAYNYAPTGGNTSYNLTACLERNTDSDAAGGAACNGTGRTMTVTAP